MKKKIFAAFLAVSVTASSLVSCGSRALKESSDFYDIYVKDDGKVVENSYAGGWNGNFSYTTADSATSDYEAPMLEAEEFAEEVAEGKVELQSKRKIIYTSSYDIQTKNYDESVFSLDALLAKYGAYFESSNTYGTAENGNRRSNYAVRVPVENYKAFTGEAGTLGVVISSSQNNKDITEQYFDTEARLESAYIREERVLEILKNAAMLDDVLALERELSDIRYEIESYTGALRKYDSLVNFSTVNISITEVSDVAVPKTTPLTFTERVKKAFNGGINDFVENIEEFVVFLSYNIIGIAVWLVIFGTATGVLVGISRKKKKANKKKEKSEQE